MQRILPILIVVFTSTASLLLAAPVYASASRAGVVVASAIGGYPNPDAVRRELQVEDPGEPVQPVFDLSLGGGGGLADVACPKDAFICLGFYLSGMLNLGVSPTPALSVDVRGGGFAHTAGGVLLGVSGRVRPL